MEVLDPLIEGGGKGTVLGKSRTDCAAAGEGAHAGKAEACHYGPLEELTTVDLPALKLAECLLLQKVFLFFPNCHARLRSGRAFSGNPFNATKGIVL